MSDLKGNPRAQQVLKILVERYIQEGNPIGSKTLAEEYALGLSPASIRHILADLEDAGFLTSPHTSAGRIPTERGYRFFVNTLLMTKPLESETVTFLEKKLNPDMDTAGLVQSASSLLSGMTQMIGVVALPRLNRQELRQVEFLPLSNNRILVILVLNNREVQNRIIYSDRIYTASELQQAANYLNTHFIGKDLSVARQELLQAMQSDRDHLSDLLKAALERVTPYPDCAVAGQNHFLNYTQGGDLGRLKILFDAFTQKQDILSLLDHALNAEGLQIFIGKESGYEAFDGCSIVATSYSIDGQLVGSLGVIGPTRMPYERVISAVDVTAKLLSAALNQS